jgi:dUTP pyrophosphatase
MLKTLVTWLQNFIINLLDKFGIINVIYYHGKKPYRKYKGDAGFDLYVSEDVSILPNETIKVPVYTHITSRKLWFLLIGRSSTFKIRNLLVTTAIIDNGYTGDMSIIVSNVSKHVRKINKGDRVCQIIPFKVNNNIWLRPGFVISGERGDKGYGSTGK